jgi:hypothetical protein
MKNNIFLTNYFYYTYSRVSQSHIFPFSSVLRRIYPSVLQKNMVQVGLHPPGWSPLANQAH